MEHRQLRTLHQPELVSAEAWLAPNATVVGSVSIGPEASVWFGAVIRGDVEPIEIGAGTNVQDLACLHSDPGLACRLGARVTVGHGAIVHGCHVEDEVLIGMGAILLNGARIGTNSIVGAGALVTEGKQIPPRCLVVGTPARIVRELTDQDIEKIRQGAAHYIDAARQYRQAAAPTSQ